MVLLQPLQVMLLSVLVITSHAVGSTTARHLSEELIAGFEPQTTVTDHVSKEPIMIVKQIPTRVPLLRRHSLNTHSSFDMHLLSHCAINRMPLT